MKDRSDLVKEREQLKSDVNPHQKSANYWIKEHYKLEKENEQLKQSYSQLKHRHSLLHDVCIEAECDRDSYYKDVVSLEKENDELKKDVEYWKQVASQYSNEVNVLEHKLKGDVE